MDRNVVYPGSIPLDTDLLALNRNTMIALGYLAQAVLGGSTIADGLACVPTVPSSMSIVVGPGSITQLTVTDTNSFGSLPADAISPLLKMGINQQATSFSLAAPTTSGQSINYLVQATLQEADINPAVLPYYNAANPSQPYSGPLNSGTAQNTQRTQRVQIQIKAGAAAVSGSQSTPPIDNGWVGLYVVVVAYGQTAVNSSGITTLPTAPFVAWKLPALRPGFASGVQTFAAAGNFVVPNGVSQLEVEIWGGGSGTYASTTSAASGGGSGGGYARKRITGVTTGQLIAVSIGGGGNAGSSGVAPGAGGLSSFGSYVSASGGSLNGLALVGAPQNGASPAGIGINGDVNTTGSAGQNAIGIQGGQGGGAPMSGAQSSGTFGLPGAFPGGGASGPGNPGGTPYAGAAGAYGLVVVRW